MNAGEVPAVPTGGGPDHAPEGTAGPLPFRLGDRLPEGITLLEASAGTGKTHTIAALAVRYLAEGIGIDRLLVVTFTRSATGELRSRVRDRLVTAEAALRRALSGERGDPDDELVGLLTAGAQEDVARRQRALVGALADFDAATITTIHGFCEQVLHGLGTAADCGRDLHFVEDLGDLVDEVVDDLYVRKFVDADQPAFSRHLAGEIVRAAVANRHTAIEPSGGVDGSPEGLRASLARRGRDEVVRRGRAAGMVGYDDQLDRLCATLHGPSADIAVHRLRQRFAAVLVDEFQDTDPVQWDIFRTTFERSGAPLLLIGDPKQAIYSFRGADVWTYLVAAEAADHRYTLGTNWRSDQPLLDAVDAVLAGATLGHPEIPYRRVTAPPDHLGPGITGPETPAPLRIRLVHRGDRSVETTKRGWAQADSAREAVAVDLADDVVALLSAGDRLVGDGGGIPVAPSHVAVLVRANHEATVIHRALDAVGVPAVISGGGSVFATPAASHWMTLLEALEQPASLARARAVTLTPFLGWDAARLVAAADAELDDLQARLHRWAGVLGTDGVAALAETVTVEVGMAAQLLAGEGGERRLTDLRHVAELLHAAALSSGAGVRALTTWLGERITGAGTDTAVEDRSRRLESDAAAVQIQTIHRSKGLEYPVVYLPYLWLAFPDKDLLPLYHDPDHDDRRTIDVGGDRPDGYQRHRARAGEERRGEDLRQAYVALTRARHRVVAWWVTGAETKSSPLARLLLSSPGDTARPGPARIPADDDELEARFHQVAGRAPGRIGIERVGSPRRVRWHPAPAPDVALQVAPFDRSLDRSWRRSSYTAITSGAHGASAGPVVASEAEEPGMTDESAPSDGSAPTVPDPFDHPELKSSLQAVPSPMADLPAGAGFGIAVHAVLETTDFAAADLPDALRSGIMTALRGGGAPDGMDPESLVSALEAVIDSPLGPLAGSRGLRGVPRADRMDELGFELPLAGGDHPIGQVTVAGIAACLRRWIPPADPLAGYPDRLEDPVMAQALRGYLTGSVDLVLRLPDADGPRHLVVDYKTNWLGAPGEALTAWHYRPARLAAAMVAEHYPLQAVLYLVALHRFLRWRMAGYEPDRHLGGVMYLFLRGMAGGGTPLVDGLPCGVFAWRPAAGMVVELSDLLDAGDRW